MAANVEAMVREGIASAKAGKKDDARILLMKAVELDPYNEDGWLWLSGLVDAPEDQRTCLENVIAINPANQRAVKGLEYLNRSGGSAPKSASPAPAPLSPPPAPPAPAEPESSPFGGFSSVEWGDDSSSSMPSSSPSSSFKPAEPSKEVLDDWVSSLGLPGSGGPSSSSKGSGPTSPFTSTDFSADEAPAFSDPFAGMDFDTNDPAPSSSSSFGSYSSAPAFNTSSAFTAPPPEPVRSPAPSRMSPKVDDGAFRSPAQEPSLFDALDEDDDGEIEVPEELEIFQVIPREIEPTRLPGSKEGASPVVTLIAGVLFLLNLGVAALLMSKLLG